MLSQANFLLVLPSYFVCPKSGIDCFILLLATKLEKPLEAFRTDKSVMPEMSVVWRTFHPFSPKASSCEFYTGKDANCVVAATQAILITAADWLLISMEVEDVHRITRQWEVIERLDIRLGFVQVMWWDKRISHGTMRMCSRCITCGQTCSLMSKLLFKVSKFWLPAS